MILALLLSTFARAEPAGHYHPVDIAAASARFADAQEVAGRVFQERQAQAREMAAALTAYETALDLLGDRAAPAERERHTALRTTFGRQSYAVQAFAQAQLDAFDEAFQAALARALGARTAVLCEAAPARGLRMGPMGGAPKGEPCQGPALNSELAAAMDRDPQLARAIAELVDAVWPAFTPDVAPQAPTGNATTYLIVDRWLAREGAAALRAIDVADEEARAPFAIAIENDAPLEERRALVEAARSLTARTAAARAAWAHPVLVAAETAASKAGTPLSWCAQPEVFGGCQGEALSESAAAALLANGRVQRAMRAAAAARPTAP